MRRRIVFALTCVLAVTLVVSPETAQQEGRPSFVQWLAELRSEALSRGIRQEIVDEALGNLTEPLPVVIERDRAQAETVLPLETYVSQRLTARMVRTGRQMATRHAKLLNQVADKYGVPSAVITAIWGVESNYGDSAESVRPSRR